MESSFRNANRQDSPQEAVKVVRSSRAWLVRAFSNPVVGITGSLASILSILLAIYFYVTGLERCDLTYSVHPVRAAVIRTGQIPKLQVSVNHTLVQGDVTAAQIAFWNAGKKPIRQDAVLREFAVRTPNGVRILEARLRKVSRDVAGISLETDQAEQGRVLVRWRILENGDGGVIQVIYGGDETTPIVADAVIEGQAHLSLLESGPARHSPEVEYARSQFESRFIYLLMAGIGAFILVVYCVLVGFTKWRGYKLHWTHWLVLAQAISNLASALFLYLRAPPPGPPFGF